MTIRARFVLARRGFTLLELVITVILIGILSVISIPTFTRSAERARVRDAQASLSAIFSAERIYRLDENTFGNAGNLWGGANNYMSNPNNEDWTFTIPTATAAALTARATRGGTGGWAGDTIEVDQAFDGERYGGTHPLRDS